MLSLRRLVELVHQRVDAARGREQAWLVSKGVASAQTINNWAVRGVPPRNWAAIASALECSVDELIGRQAPSWPLTRITQAQWEALSERDRGALEQAMLVELRAIQAESRKRPPTAA